MTATRERISIGSDGPARHPEEAAFRAELRAWLEEHLPDELHGHRGGAARFDGPAMRAWSRALYDGGYAGLTWPKEYGGGGAPFTHQCNRGQVPQCCAYPGPPNAVQQMGPDPVAHPLIAGDETFVVTTLGRIQPGPGIPRRYFRNPRPALADLLASPGIDAVAAAHDHGYPLREIARHLGVHASTVSRRLRRHRTKSSAATDGT